MAIVMKIDHGKNKGASCIDDRCVVKTQEEVDEIQNNCNRIYSNYLYQQMIKQRNAKTNGDDETA
jgi:hypothetical protein